MSRKRKSRKRREGVDYVRTVAAKAEDEPTLTEAEIDALVAVKREERARLMATDAGKPRPPKDPNPLAKIRERLAEGAEGNGRFADDTVTTALTPWLVRFVACLGRHRGVPRLGLGSWFSDVSSVWDLHVEGTAEQKTLNAAAKELGIEAGLHDPLWEVAARVRERMLVDAKLDVDLDGFYSKDYVLTRDTFKKRGLTLLCPKCQRPVRVTTGGVAWSHKVSRRGRKVRCPGSGYRFPTWEDE